MLNICRNGGFDHAQLNEGALINCVADTSYHVCDEWHASHFRSDKSVSSPFEWTAQRMSYGADSGDPSHSIKIKVTEPVTSVGYYDRWRIHGLIRLEDGVSLQYGRGDRARTTSLSFLVRATQTGRHAVSITSQVSNRAIFYMFDITAANTWQLITIDGIPGCPDWDWENITTAQNWVNLVFTCCMGADSTAADADEGTWYSSPYNGTIHHPGADDTLSNVGMTVDNYEFEVAEVYWTPTDTALLYQRDPMSLARCQRRIEKSYDQGVLPGTANTHNGGGMVYIYNGMVANVGGTAVNFTSDGLGISQPFMTEKAHIDSSKLRLYSPKTGQIDKAYHYAAGVDVGVAYKSVGSHGFIVAFPGVVQPANLMAHYVYNGDS